jgi:hypothetical protein
MYQLINQNYHCSLKECNTSCQIEAKQTNHLIKENNMYQLINQNYHCSLKECNTSCQTEAKQTIIY